MTAYLILHGLANRRPPGHWQYWLAGELRKRNRLVRYPQLPDPDLPDLQRWLDVLATEYAALGDDERVVVCHSLACALWVRAAQRGVLGSADRVLLVAPPGPAVLADAVTADLAGDWPAEPLRQSSKAPIRLVASDDDPYCAEGPAADVYGKPLGLDAETLTGQGHLTIADGYGPWPAVLDWCLEGSTRFAR